MIIISLNKMVQNKMEINNVVFIINKWRKLSRLVLPCVREIVTGLCNRMKQE